MDFYKRIKAVRERMRANRVDGVLVSSPPNKFYLSELFSSSGYVLITPNRQYIAVDSRYFEEIKSKNKVFEVLLLSGGNTIEAVINRIVKREGLHRLGFEGKEVSYEFYQRLKKSVVCEVVSLDLSSIRKVKDYEEIATIQKACMIVEAAFQHIVGFIEAGMKEKAIENELVRTMRAYGGQKEAFDCIVASGPRGAIPHGKASDRVIQKGELITLDFGVRYRQYCSDMTRTISVGKCPAELLELYEIVNAAVEEVIKKAQANMTLGRLDAIARDIISRNGYGQYFGHNLGHGLGLEVHEYPAVAPGSSVILQEGMVITVEPGIYIPGLGGVRIEEDIVITGDGCRVLTNRAKELLVI